jgi:hypothetical protein
MQMVNNFVCLTSITCTTVRSPPRYSDSQYKCQYTAGRSLQFIPDLVFSLRFAYQRFVAQTAKGMLEKSGRPAEAIRQFRRPRLCNRLVACLNKPHGGKDMIAISTPGSTIGTRLLQC